MEEEQEERMKNAVSAASAVKAANLRNDEQK